MRFEKVSFEQYLKSYDGWEEFDELNLNGLREEYDNIKLPKRSTNGSAGYDFFSPIRFVLISNDEKRRTVKIPTGIRVILDDDKFLEFEVYCSSLAYENFQDYDGFENMMEDLFDYDPDREEWSDEELQEGYLEEPNYYSYNIDILFLYYHY